MKKVRDEHIHRSRSGEKDMPSAVDDAADVISKHTKKTERIKDKKYGFREIDYEKPPHY
jgi:hypothetical protein